MVVLTRDRIHRCCIHTSAETAKPAGRTVDVSADKTDELGMDAHCGSGSLRRFPDCGVLPVRAPRGETGSLLRVFIRIEPARECGRRTGQALSLLLHNPRDHVGAHEARRVPDSPVLAPAVVRMSLIYLRIGTEQPTKYIDRPSDRRASELFGSVSLNSRKRTMKKAALALVVVAALAVAGAGALTSSRDPGYQDASRPGRDSTATVTRRDFVRAVRLSGTVEAVRSTTVAAPRLAGPNTSSLVITRLIKAGTTVNPGDLLVEFDRQLQIQTALDRRAELNDLDQQIRRKDAEARAARARDDSELQQAESARARAQLEMIKNEMLPKIQVEKNTQALEQAEARLKQLKTTYDLKRRAAEADIRILEIRRGKAESAMKQAETNATRMEVRSPIAGLAVLRTVWKTGNMAEIQEGEEIRAGVPVVDIVSPDVMRVRARVSQADINDLRVGQPVRMGLDAYPDLSFEGRVAQISPLGVTSNLSPKVRTFMALIDIKGSHPNLMPDLTASLDVELERVRGALIVPRDAVWYDGETPHVRIKRGDRYEDRAVTLGPLNRHEAVIASGLEDGATVARNVGARSAS